MKIGKHNIESYMTMVHEFPGIRIIDGVLNPTKWNLEIDLVAIDLATTQAKFDEMQMNGSIAYQKVLFWLDTCLPGCVFVGSNNPTGMEMAMMCDNMLMHCPDEPTDDLIVALLHSKITAISNGHLHIGQIRLVSTDTSAKYTYNVPAEGYGLPKKVKDYIDLPSLYRKPWWERNDGFSFEFLKPKGCKDKLVDLYQAIQDPLDSFEESMSAIEFTFDPEPKEPAEIIQVEKWQPRTV